MRTRTSLVAVLAAGIWAATGLAAGPGQIYNDYARDGHLSCSYSSGELEALLRSGSINQYGDPLTLARLKLAARKQLAGGCRKGGSEGTAVTTGGGGTTSTGTGAKQHPRSKNHHPRRTKSRRPEVAVKASTSGGNGSFVAGRALIIGLLAVALALGGWLTKRGLSARG
jgi:hypothetical protein